ncbi:HAMP domain-containing sensor histidine kinase [Actinacidiphila sp. DG2A-62]|uniref:sensor histidine kinase n=1 Tax=Actinacidiphila sp. DG2A-62 TaxID=3108821 RepID=UPI002DB900CE|nr:HAMP domain-containing sensor histidine kinase [Actinacidiphila sp. DG2A-62]MEC3998718.1 HAMP domain-containing sensor histidine kinase [Actinacidiphila sp. DG2A-62]
MARLPLVVRSLRFRLVAGFALVAVVSALGTGALTFREARTSVLKQGQDSVVDQFRESVDAVTPELTAPLGQDRLAAVVGQLATAHRSQHWRIAATYRGARVGSEPGDAFPELTPELVRSVDTRLAAVFQRVHTAGRSSLVVGLPVVYGSGDAERVRSGLAFYLVVPQTEEQRDVRALVTAIERASVPALCLAVLLALVVAGSVLRPIRALRQATRKMADGRLDTRLAVNGSDELADLSRTFNDTADALERSVSELRQMEARSRRFVADVSHELRTPLAAMSALTEVLDEESLRLEHGTAEAIRLITDETGRLVRLVNDLMEISRFDAGAVELSLDEIDLAESVRQSLAARGWDTRVEARLPDALRAQVDPRRFDVVVANLVGNALRHGAPPFTVDLAPRLDDAGRAWARLVVADRGPGIGAAALPHIFERFYKASSARVRSDSSGLGLAITAENVALHGGRVRAENAPGGGALFTVDLPVRPTGRDGEERG